MNMINSKALTKLIEEYIKDKMELLEPEDHLNLGYFLGMISRIDKQ